MPAVIFLGVLAAAGYAFAGYLLIHADPRYPVDAIFAFHLFVLSSTFLTGAAVCGALRYYGRRIIAALQPHANDGSEARDTDPAPLEDKGAFGNRGPASPAPDPVADVLREHGLTPPPRGAPAEER